ncbi:IS3 family transposase [Corynebacterium sp. CNJ-954]|uniref:IS3 family transposase n=1 Tax=Corynebacterium sp. CNJ-954 TaxID=1904962 RepID=UPI000AC2FC1F|nr:IS3 family transposase [Corynebacterium sp. CNJ-954]
MIIGFIDHMRSYGYAVESICRVLRDQGVQIAARTYRHAKATGPSPRRVSDAQLLDTLHGPKGTPESLYGRRKVVAHLRRLGHEVAHCTVDRLMGVAGMAGVSRRKSLSRGRKSEPEDRAGDLLHRDFTAAAPNLVWVADFTYVMTTSGWVYVAFIVDVFSLWVVAWHAQTAKGVELVRIPLRLALWERQRGDHPVDRESLIHHSDARSQYTAVRFTGALADEGNSPAVGTVGDAHDNALMETINGLYKAECISSRVFSPEVLDSSCTWRSQRRRGCTGTNTSRLHSSLGMVPPAEFEDRFWVEHATLRQVPEKVTQPI